MAKEIERKFLVSNEGWKSRALDEGVPIVQGYLAADEDQEIRVRLKGDKAFVTFKNKTDQPGVRNEFEYPIPFQDAQDILTNFKNHAVEKTRYRVEGPDSKEWEVDVYSGKHAGLVVAELELKSIDEPFKRPHWAGTDITNDKRFSNKNLAQDDTLPSLAGIKKA